MQDLVRVVTTVGVEKCSSTSPSGTASKAVYESTVDYYEQQPS